jgi:F5/8 type C domain
LPLFRKLIERGYYPAMVVTILLVILGFRWFFLQRNLAFGKNVRTSPVLLGEPAGIVNGVMEWGGYALHTRRGSAWIEIDLERLTEIATIRVYGRGDGYHLDSRASISVEYSLDGVKYVGLGRCGLVLTQVAPCDVQGANVSARYVRLAHPTHLVLSEVEVF